jgi:hypothetical protein
MPLEGLGVRKDVIGVAMAALPDGLPWILASSLTGAGITGVLFGVPNIPLLGPERTPVEVLARPAPLKLVPGVEINGVELCSELSLYVPWLPSPVPLTF